jgi:hypothetical protein
MRLPALFDVSPSHSRFCDKNTRARKKYYGKTESATPDFAPREKPAPVVCPRNARTVQVILYSWSFETAAIGTLYRRELQFRARDKLLISALGRPQALSLEGATGRYGNKPRRERLTII